MTDEEIRHTHVQFQSTPSAWRETADTLEGIGGEIISIHSLRMEGDFQKFNNTHFAPYFNPLPPHGGRPPVFCWEVCFCDISIHSLRMEGDLG